MLQRVLMRMRKRSATRSSGASTWLAGVGGWTGARSGARRSQDHKRATAAGKRRKWKRQRHKEEEERGMGSTPPRAALFIRGSTYSACYGSFRRIIRLNGYIPINSRDNLGGFVAD
jgi:hypothetical protein